MGRKRDPVAAVLDKFEQLSAVELRIVLLAGARTLTRLVDGETANVSATGEVPPKKKRRGRKAKPGPTGPPTPTGPPVSTGPARTGL